MVSAVATNKIENVNIAITPVAVADGKPAAGGGEGITEIDEKTEVQQ